MHSTVIYLGHSIEDTWVKRVSHGLDLLWQCDRVTPYSVIDLVNTLRPRQDGRLFPDDIFKCIFFNENVWISIKISLRFVPKALINNIPALFQIMAWRRSGDKPLSEPMMVSLPTHICVNRTQWIKYLVSQWRWYVFNMLLGTRIIYENIEYLGRFYCVRWQHSPLLCPDTFNPILIQYYKDGLDKIDKNGVLSTCIDRVWLCSNSTILETCL